MKPQAQESRRIQLLRKKLEKAIDAEKQQFTDQTLTLILEKISASTEKHQKKPLSKRKIRIKKD